MRVDSWRSDLDQVVQIHQSKDFEWGKWDCWTFISDCIGAQTGQNWLALYGDYSCELSAQKMLRLAKVRSVYQFFLQHYQPCEVGQLGHGDVGFVQVRTALTSPAVVLGDYAINRDETGWNTVKLTQITDGFKI